MNPTQKTENSKQKTALARSEALPQVIVAQLGARMRYAVPALLHRAGMLGHFYTDTYVGRGSRLSFLGTLAGFFRGRRCPPSLKRLGDRREERLPAHKVTAFNLFGFDYAWALRRARDRGETERIYLKYGRRFCELVLRQGFRRADAVYAFPSAALPLFEKAQERGRLKVLEQIIAPQKIVTELLLEEQSLFPGWGNPYPGLAVWKPRMELEEREWRAADAVICPSAYVARGLGEMGAPPEKVRVVPYGVDLGRFAVRRPPWDGRRPLRVLFAGGVTLRKGPQYLYQAMKMLNSLQIEARLVGTLALGESARRRLRREGLELTGQAAWSEMPGHYQWADLLVFPSLCEGSATVTYEALAAGLPVITTPNAGSVVRDGVEGFIVPIRDAEALAAGIDKLMRQPGLLAEMSHQARARAEEFSWERYGERLTACLREVCSGKMPVASCQ